jgi:drug/metabolite transporter (DMT)-like permease
LAVLPYFSLAILASALMASGLLLMKSRSGSLPAATGRDTFIALLQWLRDPAWIGGLAIQTVGYALYVIALSRSPVSMIAVMMQGGVALFVILSVTVLGERAGRREWVGICAIILGMVALTLSLPGGEGGGAADPRALVLLCGMAILLGILPAGFERLRESGAAIAMAAGLAFGLGSLFTKASVDYFLASQDISLALRVAANPYIYGLVVANVIGIVLLQNSFHATRGIIAMPLSSALSNAVPIVGGMLVFGETLPTDPTSAALRIGAFALAIAAGILLAVSGTQNSQQPFRDEGTAESLP